MTKRDQKSSPALKISDENHGLKIIAGLRGTNSTIIPCLILLNMRFLPSADGIIDNLHYSRETLPSPVFVSSRCANSAQDEQKTKTLEEIVMSSHTPSDSARDPLIPRSMTVHPYTARRSLASRPGAPATLVNDDSLRLSIPKMRESHHRFSLTIW